MNQMKVKLTEEEKIVRMGFAEKIAKDMFTSLLGKKINDDKMVVADTLHVGVVFSSYIIDMAGRRSSASKEEILEQFIEALTEYVEEDAFEVIPLN